MTELLMMGGALCFLLGMICEMLMNEHYGTTDVKVRCKNLELTKKLEEMEKELATYKHYWLVHNLEEELNKRQMR